jgi:hypothetical protein
LFKILGFPLVSVETSGNNVIFTQKRFSPNVGEIYGIPLVFTTKNEADFSKKTPKFWLTSENITITLNSTIDDSFWLILNTQQVGYYRVDYSTKLWHSIIKQLTENFQVIHPINRVVLRDEIYMAWKDFDRVTAADMLDSLRYFPLEEDPRAWSRSNAFLSEIQTRLVGQHAHRHFRRFVTDLTKHHLARLGFEHIEDEHYDQTSLRNSVRKWSCTVWDEECLNFEHEKWEKFRRNQTDLNSFNFCFAMINLDMNTFNEILDGITKNVDYPSRDSYLINLGCNTNYTNLMNLLMSTIDFNNILSNSERLLMMRSALSGGYQGMTALFHFIDVHFIPVVSLGREEFVETVIQMSRTVTSECQINTLALLRNHAVEYGFINQDERRLITAGLNAAVAWNAKNLDLIDDWFEFSYRDPIVPTITVFYSD